MKVHTESLELINCFLKNQVDRELNNNIKAVVSVLMLKENDVFSC